MLADRVLHTTTTTGTGSYDLIDPSSALYLSAVASVGSGNQLVYAVEFGGSWEICRGVVTAGSPATLTRNLIRSSTGALINWGAGTKTLYSVAQADVTRFGGRGSLPATSGTANAQTVPHVTPMRSLQPGMEVIFVPSFTNTGATTLAVDALGAITLLAPGGGACTGSELRAGVPASAVYNGTNWRLMSYSPSATGQALMSAADAATARSAIGAANAAGQTFSGAIATSTGDITAQSGSLRAQFPGLPAQGQVILGNGSTRFYFDGTTMGLNAPLSVPALTVNGATMAPLPAASGASIWQKIGDTLPAGGTWAYFLIGFSGSSPFAHEASVAAGGSLLMTGATNYTGFAWRIA